MQEARLQSSSEEITRLCRCLNDLARIMALPVLSTGDEPSRIARALLNELVGMLGLSFAFGRFDDPEGGLSVEVARVAGPFEESTSEHQIGEAVKLALGHGQLWPRKAKVTIGGVQFSVASTILGFQGELGVVVAGCQRLDFPQQTEALLLDVAANQAAILLQQARLLTSRRTLAKANEALTKSELESRPILDSIPGFVALLTKAGEIEMANRHLLEYFGAPIEEVRQWGTNGMVHPEDLPDAAEGFTRSIESGTPYESEHRLRRSDGVYRWFQSRGSPLRDANGNIVRWCWLLTDIDDRKRAEDAARSSERNLKLIIDTIPTLAWSARTDGSAEFLNQHFLDYVGLSAEQASDWGWTAAVHPDDLNGLAAMWERVRASEQPGEAEARIRRFDGAYRWFLFRANPLRDESGKIVKWCGIHLDIQDRKLGEDALRARELSWRQIVDNIPGLVATTGGMGEVEFLNRQTLQYFGKTNEELKNWALIDAVHPEDLPRVIEARIKSIEAGQIYDVEHRCRGADGVYRWFQVRGLPVINAGGTITAWYLLLTDIDDRKKAEEALQSSERNLSLMINAIPTLIHVLRPDGSVLDVNQAVLDYTGLPLEDVQKEDYRDRVFHPDDVERLREERRQALTRAVPFENEQRVLDKDGRYRWFLARYNPLLDEQGRIDRWYVAGFDIEDRKRTEDLRLEERVNERARIARELHDTLLQSFQGLLMKVSAVKYIIRDRPREAEDQLDRVVEQVRQAIIEGRDAVQGLRSSTVIASDLAGAITTFGEGLASDAGSPEFRVSVEGKPRDLPPLVRDEVYRIASEALRNAFRHADASRIEVEIHYNNREVRLRVRDDGKGIDPKVLGTGGRAGHHGMPGMHERAKLAGGKLTVWSAQHSGTEIELTIPAALAYVGSSPAAQTTAWGQRSE
jgi:PAS domain S-box-containing protein